VIDSELSLPQIHGVSKTHVKKDTYKRVDNCKDNDTLVIDNTGLLDVGRIQENMPEGRCIVDLSFILKEIRRNSLQLFTTTSKFQKNLRRGVFLACLLYHEDKVLVTNEDFLPMIEIDETYPSCIYNDI